MGVVRDQVADKLVRGPSGVAPLARLRLAGGLTGASTSAPVASGKRASGRPVAGSSTAKLYPDPPRGSPGTPASAASAGFVIVIALRSSPRLSQVTGRIDKAFGIYVGPYQPIRLRPLPRFVMI